MKIELRIATPQDESHVAFLVQMINEVYQASEGNIWIDNHNRISKERLLEVIKANELLLAVNKNQIYGCIHLEKMNTTHYKFKMLVTNSQFKRQGIGSMLVNYAEQQAVIYGAKTMQLELLVPTDFIHPDKVFLDNWYTKIGYKNTSEHDVDYVHQGISQFLKVDCIAKVYEKKIT